MTCTLFAALALQSSLLAPPLYLDPAPPELRAVQYMVFPHVGVEAAPPGVELSRDEALAAAVQVLAAIRDEDASFPDIAKRIMRGRSIELGSYARGMLPAAMDTWLFAADELAISDPLDTPYGVTLLRRVPAWAGARTILLSGAEAEARAAVVTRRLQAGEPFADVARETTDDLAAREHGGATLIFQRGASDKLLKAACFDMEVGVWRGPITSPLGLHFVQHVAPKSLEGLAPYERTCVRLRAMVISHAGIEGAPESRTREEAFALAESLAKRLAAGESFEALARAHDEDPGGRARAGDLGWVYRGDPRRPEWTDLVLSRPVGWVTPTPFVTPRGYVLVTREE